MWYIGVIETPPGCFSNLRFESAFEIEDLIPEGVLGFKSKTKVGSTNGRAVDCISRTSKSKNMGANSFSDGRVNVRNPKLK